MSGGSVITVRIVKCPKCNTRLVEPTRDPIYRCGRCNTVLQAKNCITKIEDANSLVSEPSLLALTRVLGHTSDDIEYRRPSQNESHISETGNNSEQIEDCATNTEEVNISNAQCIHNEVLGSDGGNSGQIEPADIANDSKRPSKDEMNTASARKLFLTTNLPDEPSSSTPATETPCTSSFSMSGSGTLCSSPTNNSTVDAGTIGSLADQCQSKEEFAVQSSCKNGTHENPPNYESSDSEEVQMKRKSGPINAKDGIHHLNASKPVKGEYSEADIVSNSSGVKLESSVTRGSSLREDGFSGRAEDYEKSYPSEYNIVNHTFEYGTASATDPNSELRDKVRKMFEIASSTSGRGYDGGSSSYEDHDDQIHKQTTRVSNFAGNDGRRNFHTKIVSNLSTMQQQAKEKEKENIRQMKMVHELQEDLKYISTNKRNINGRNLPNCWSGRRMPAPNKYGEFMDQDGLHLKNSRYPFTRSEQGTYWPGNPSCIPSSGEPTYLQRHYEYSCQHRCHNGYSCQHRHPVDQQFSAQRGPSICNVCTLNTGRERVQIHHGNQRCNPHSSSSYSPQWRREAEFPSSSSSPQWRRESEFPSRVRDITYVDQRDMERYVEARLANSIISTDQAHKDEVKRCRARHHMRPTASGAPFITCYHCWTTLQIPADSFIFRRRIHKLKCGSCSNILNFSLESRFHIVPHVHGYIALLPIEVNDRSILNRGTAHLSTSCHSHGIQTSCSDNEFGNSFYRSCSTTEGEQVSLAAPSHAIQASNVGGEETPYKDSSDILEGRKKQFTKDLSLKGKRSVEILETEGPSTSKTFNIKNYSLERKPRSGSPLHKLMGYTSISQVIHGLGKGASESFRSKTAR